MYFEQPSEELATQIKASNSEDPERFKHNLALLEEWMQLQPHMPKNYDKRMLPIYLRGCKHDMESCKRKLELYFIVKTTIPELMQNRNPDDEDMQFAYQWSDLAVIPKLTPEGFRVSWFNCKSSDLSKYKIDWFMRRGAMTTCFRCVNETINAGDILVYDASNLTAAHAASFLTPLVRKSIVHGPDAYPMRVKQIHVINAPGIIEKVVSIVRSLIKEKLRNRFIVHSSPEKLKDYIPLECLPSDYGGSQPSLAELSKNLYEAITKDKAWFKEHDTDLLIGPVPEKYNYVEDYGTGTEGSFRKLAID